MTAIPKIIHQIWSGIHEPLPKHFRLFGETWKENHPDWKYEFWDNDRINSFINNYYPQYWDTYQSFQYDIQRWDAIRYLILDKIGGLYVDFDFECIKPHDVLFSGQTCCFAKEPETHKSRDGRPIFLGNALMACIPDHPFMKKIIENVFNYVPKKGTLSSEQRFTEVMTTTGPLALSAIYEKYSDKEQVFLIPDKQASPYDVSEMNLIRKGYESEEFDKRLEDAYSVHHFFGGWL